MSSYRPVSSAHSLPKLSPESLPVSGTSVAQAPGIGCLVFASVIRPETLAAGLKWSSTRTVAPAVTSSEVAVSNDEAPKAQTSAGQLLIWTL